VKFILILVLVMPNGSGSIATAEFDDFEACETAGLLTVPQVPPNARLERRCVAKATQKKR